MEPQMTELTLPFLSPGTAANQYPFGDLLRAGATLAMGSDWPVSTANVYQQIEVAVTRRHPSHRDHPPLNEKQALTLPQALLAFTEGSARANRNSDLGRLEVGAMADVTIADRNPFVEKPIGETGIRATVIGGEVVFSAS
jgi:predicted amidohydrolase YtcJ